MSKPFIREHNLETNEIVDREMTEEEFNRWQIEQEEIMNSIAVKSAAKAALLDKLGITADEAKLLLGGN